MTTKEKLTNHMNLYHVSQNKLAKALSVSQPQINQYLNDKYPGDVANLESKIERYLVREFERRRSQSLGGFVMTTPAKELLAALSYCHSMKEIGFAWGLPGNSKTESVKHYCEQYPETILITAGQEIIRDGIIYALADALKVKTCRNKYHTMKNIIDNRMGHDDMIIIDEAQFLSIESLEVARKVYDLTDAPIFLVGQPRTKDEILNKKQKEMFAQIISRIGVWVELPLPKKEDVVLLCEAANVHEKEIHEYCCNILQNKDNSLRTVHKLLKFGLKYAQGQNKDLTLDMIEEVSKYLMVD